MTTPAHETLADRFCRLHAITRDRFELALIERTLNPQAHALRRLLQLMPRDYFATDIEFARRVGAIAAPDQLETVIVAFHAHPVSRRALRRRIRVRLSLPRLRRLVAQTFNRSPPAPARVHIA